MKLSKLFENCAYNIPYQQVGDGVSYAFVESGKTLYIYFQGSHEISDWVRNFLFPVKPYKDMVIPYKVHRGFLEAWKEVEDIIINKITETDSSSTSKDSHTAVTYKWQHIIVVGYSHGAALAGLCYECCWYHRPDLRKDYLKGYGFESPRFYGGWKVKDELKERWENFMVIRTNNDLVTHCPPAFLGFCHVGKLLKVNGDTSLVDKKWVPKCIKSHYPQVVLDALKKYEEEK